MVYILDHMTHPPSLENPKLRKTPTGTPSIYLLHCFIMTVLELLSGPNQNTLPISLQPVSDGSAVATTGCFQYPDVTAAYAIMAQVLFLEYVSYPT